jgi:hypothetical protein
LHRTVRADTLDAAKILLPPFLWREAIGTGARSSFLLD